MYGSDNAVHLSSGTNKKGPVGEVGGMEIGKSSEVRKEGQGEE